jgi:hypothetical protein
LSDTAPWSKQQHEVDRAAVRYAIALAAELGVIAELTKLAQSAHLPYSKNYGLRHPTDSPSPEMAVYGPDAIKLIAVQEAARHETHEAYEAYCLLKGTN